MATPWAYLNGDWVRGYNLQIAVDDLGFLMGATVSERLRTFRGEVFRLNEHLRRLRRSLEIIGLDADKISAQVAGAIPEFLRRNSDQIAADDDWTINAFATPGASGTGQPSVCVYGYPLQFHLWSNLYDAGVPVVISDVRQIPPGCLPPELKCRSRMHFYLADRQAADRQPRARAILLDEDGFVAESTTANVLVYREGEGLVTPPAEHVLFGVSLHVVKELAAQLGVPFMTRRLMVDEFRSANEAMLASTSVCVLPIIQCDGKPIGDGRTGPMHGRLLEAWSKLVGVDIADQARRLSTRS